MRLPLISSRRPRTSRRCQPYGGVEVTRLGGAVLRREHRFQLAFEIVELVLGRNGSFLMPFASSEGLGIVAPPPHTVPKSIDVERPRNRATWDP